MTEEREIKRRKRPDELAKLIRALDKHSQAAVETLGRLCKSEDPKIALDAAKSLTKLLAEVKGQDDTRKLQNIMLHHKLNPGKPLLPEDEDDDTPLVEFDIIQNV